MRPVAIDFETHLIQDGLLAPPIVCGSFYSGENPAALYLRDDALERTEWLLLRDDQAAIGLNVAYDFGCFLRHRPEAFPLVWKAYAEGRVFDVGIASTLNAIAEGRLRDGDLYDKNGRRCVDPSKGKQTNRYSLALCVKEWLGRDDAKENSKYRLRYAEFDDVPIAYWPPEAVQYPKDDVVNTLDVYRAIIGAPAQNLHEVAFQSHVAFCLHLSAINGLRTDAARVETLKKNIEAHRGELMDVVLKAGLLKPNKKNQSGWSKNMALIKERVTKAWGDLTPTTEKGGVSTERKVLEESGDPVLEALGEVSKWEKLSTYVPSLEAAAKGPLNVRPNVVLATGRTSYEGLVQLMPRKGGVRECFKFRGIGSSVDYAAVELSTLSQVCIWALGYSTLGDAINSGKDPHSMLAAQIAAVPYEEFLKRVKEKDPASVDLRQGAKAGNFGLPGGMGEATFVNQKRKEGLIICELFYRDGRCGETKVTSWKERPTAAPTCLRCLEQTRELKAAWFSTWGEMRPYLNWINSQVADSDTITTFVSKMVRGGVTYTSAANHFFQSLAAVGAKRAVVAMTGEMYQDNSPLLGSRLCIFAHDETIIDIPDAGVDAVDAAARRQAAVMVEQMKTVVPDVAIKAEPALMRYWSKDAKEVKDEKGRYIPWD